MADTIDARIPMMFNPTQNIGPNFGAAIADAARVMQLQQAQQEDARQNKLRDILGKPGAFDLMGQPTPDTTSKVMGVDPASGMKLQQNALTGLNQRATLAVNQGKRDEQIQELIEPARVASMEAYQKAQGGEAAKRAVAQKVYTEELNRLTGGGHFSDEEKARLNPQFDPVRVGLMSARWQDIQKQRAVEKRADNAGTAAGVDADGQAIIIRPNAPPGRQATYLGTGQPVPPEKLTGAHKMGTAGSDRPNVAAERDAMTVADGRIAAAEQQRGSPLSPEEKAEMRRTARSDPKVQEAIRKQESTAISDDAARLTAEETLRGDWHGTVGMGRNAASMRKIADERAKIAKEKGMSGADLAANTAEFMGIISAERVLGTRGAGIDLGIAEAQKFAPMVLELSDKVDRTRFPTVNALQLAMEKGAGGEDVVRLTDALNAYKMAYTQILTRGGMPTDDSRRRSDEVIDKAWSNGQIRAAIDQLNKEMMAARSAVPEVRDNLYSALTGKGRATPQQPTPPAAAPAQAAPTTTPTDNDIMWLKKDPAAAAQFEKHFGLPAGGAKQYLEGGSTAPSAPPATAPKAVVPEPAKAGPRADAHASVPKQGDAYQPATQEQFDALQPGDVYVNPADGKKYRKK